MNRLKSNHNNYDNYHHHGGWWLKSNSTIPVGHLLIRSCSDLVQSIGNNVNNNNNNIGGGDEKKSIIQMDRPSSASSLSSIIDNNSIGKKLLSRKLSYKNKQSNNKYRSLSSSLLMNNSIETTVKHYHSKMNKRFQRSSSFSNWSAKLLPILTTTTIDNQKQNNKTFGINRNHRCMTLANGYNGKKYRSSSSSILTVSILIAVFILIWSSNMMTDTVYAVNVGGGGENESIGRNTNPLDDDDNRSLQEWEEIFHSRSADDWRNLWHHERHRRCRHDLVAHMEFVCDKDIYKLNRRRKKRSNLNNVNEIYRKSNKKDDKMENDEQQQQQQNRQYLTFKQANTFAQKQLKRFLRKNHYYSNNNNNDMAVMDIYKNNNIIKKLSGDLNSDNNNNNNNNNMDDFDHLGNGLIAVRRRQQQRQRNKRGISDECCHGQDGCSWEEYAEYCPANVRLRS